MSTSLIIGLGGGGSTIAASLQTALNLPTVAINTDTKALLNSELTDTLLIGPSVLSKYGPGAAQLGRLAAEESYYELAERMTDTEKVILAVGLGGNTGSGAAPVIARLAKELGKDVLVVVTLPFSFEESRREVALTVLKKLEALGVEVMVHDNAAAMKKWADLSLVELFANMDKKIAQKAAVRLAAES